MPPADNPAPGKRPFRFTAACLQWLLLGAVLLLVLIRIVPAVYISQFNSDNVGIALFCDDVLRHGHSLRGWNTGGHSDFFPETAIALLLGVFIHSGPALLCSEGSILFAAFFASVLLLHRRHGGRNAPVFAAALLFFMVMALFGFGFFDGLCFECMFVHGMHTGITIVALVSLALFQDAIVKGCKTSFWLLAACCFLAGASDSLFLVTFPLPLFAAAAVAAALYPGLLRKLLLPVACVVIASGAGHLLAGVVFPVGTEAGTYTHLDLHRARECVDFFFGSLSPSGSITFSILIATALGYLLFAAILLASSFSRPAGKRMPQALFILLFFCACMVVCSISASILTGNCLSFMQYRYVRLAFLMPPLLLIGWLVHIIPWTRIGSSAAVLLLSLGSVCGALFLCPPPSSYYQQAQQLIPFILPLMEKEGIEAGLADYWWANIIAFASGNRVKFRPLHPDGPYLHWLGNMRWFTGYAGGAPPKFRIFYMATLEPAKIRLLYGEPVRIVHTPGGQDLWIYPPGKSIVYDPVFDRLSSDPGHQYRIPGSLLPSSAGRREGGSLLAREGRDASGIIFYGPFIHLAPGRYRITIAYAYLAAPAPGKLVMFDTSLWTSQTDVSRLLDRWYLPYSDFDAHEVTRDITVPEGPPGKVETHAAYFGSGDVRIDSFDILSLDFP